MNALLCVAELGQTFTKLADGSFVPTRHIVEIDRFAPDFVAVAERFMGVPYLWGGRSRLGLDCSGLVQVALQAAGIECPRDSDMQQAELGDAVDVSADLDGLLRGDLIFWKGHVGIMLDGFLHAACQRASHGRRGGAALGRSGPHRARRQHDCGDQAAAAQGRGTNGCGHRRQRLMVAAIALTGGREKLPEMPA